jgi:CHAT domain-containing protein
MSTLEDQLESDPWGHAVATHPVPITDLQHELRPNELVIEYVLADPTSYGLAITSKSITPYSLAARTAIRPQIRRYLGLLSKQQSDIRTARRLFQQLVEPIAEFHAYDRVIFIPDGDLHLLPFAALHDGSQYVIGRHTTSVVSAATVLYMLRTPSRTVACNKPFVGFAPWAQENQSTGPRALATILQVFRGADGPKKSDFQPLPETRYEVITGRDQIDKLEGAQPRADQTKIGPDATEAEFKRLPLSTYQVLHLAVHGYADIEHPDRSALVFQHDPKDRSDDGLLQIREIRRLRLNSDLVVLSACKTALGPAGEGGIVNIANAFLQAGARTVVSSFWPVSDHVTSEMMKVFYSHLANREPKAEALRNAAPTTMRAGVPPYYWASFEISGDPAGTLIAKN